MLLLGRFSHVWLFATLWTVPCQAPLSMGFLQARILEWFAMPSSKVSSWPKDWNWVFCGSCIVGGFFTTEPPGKTLVALDFICPVQAIHRDTLAFLNPNPERQERDSTWPAKIEHPSLGWLWWLKDTELLRSTPVLRGAVLRQGESRYWLSHCVQLSGY